MQYKTLEHTLNDRVAILWLNRPEKRNALNATMLEEILKYLHALASEPKARILVIRGRGPVFSAGADLAFLKDTGSKSDMELEREGGLFYDCFDTLCNLAIPSICFAHGAVMGGANGIVSASDLVLATRETRFSFPEVKLGLVPATVAPFVVQRIGRSLARQLLLYGQEIDGIAALEIGLADRLTTDKQSEAVLGEIVSGILENGPEAVTVIKKMLMNTGIIDIQTRKNAIEILVKSRKTPEASEGIAAFFEKREPNWRK